MRSKCVCMALSVKSYTSFYHSVFILVFVAVFYTFVRVSVYRCKAVIVLSVNIYVLFVVVFLFCKEGHLHRNLFFVKTNYTYIFLNYNLTISFV